MTVGVWKWAAPQSKPRSGTSDVIVSAIFIHEALCFAPCRFLDEHFDDRRMEVGWSAIEAEERRSARLGRDADGKAEAEERARRVSAAWGFFAV